MLFANAIVENLKYAIISLDAINRGKISWDEFYGDPYLFYFFHMQSVLTAQGNIWNVLFRGNGSSQARRNREKLKQEFGIDPKDYPLVGDKRFRNTNEHFDDRYHRFRGRLGDFNIIENSTDPFVRRALLDTPHLRTIDLEKMRYITYDNNGEQIFLDLIELRAEMYTMLQKISTCDRMRSYIENNPRTLLLIEEVNNDQL